MGSPPLLYPRTIALIASTTEFAAGAQHGSAFPVLYAVTVAGAASTGTTSPATSPLAANVLSAVIRSADVPGNSAASCCVLTKNSDFFVASPGGSPPASVDCELSPSVGQVVGCGVSSTTRTREGWLEEALL